MFNDPLEAAIAFYTATFPDSEVRHVARTGTDGPIASAGFVIGGQAFMGCNGGPHFAFSEGSSLFVDCEDQAEVDEYRDKLVAAGATANRSPRAGATMFPHSPRIAGSLHPLDSHRTLAQFRP